MKKKSQEVLGSILKMLIASKVYFKDRLWLRELLKC
jgi:hypothetical protein